MCGCLRVESQYTWDCISIIHKQWSETGLGENWKPVDCSKKAHEVGHCEVIKKVPYTQAIDKVNSRQYLKSESRG